jgi:hypothetical protein
MRMLGHLSWSDLLRRWSGEAITHADATGLAVTPQMRASGWIGAPPALATEIAAAQERLGRSLPRSYRDFLLVSNGWPMLSYDFEQLRPVTAIGWVADVDPGLYSAVCANLGYDWPLDGDDGPPLMNRAVLLSTGPDNFLFDTKKVELDGEWDTVCWASRYPGAGDRRASFRDGMEAHYASFVRLVATESATHAEVAAQVEDAYQLALRGDRSGEAVFAAARDYGCPRADVLLPQVQVFTGQHLAVNGVVALAGNKHATDPALLADVWPMLVVAAFNVHQPQRWGLDRAIATAPGPVAERLRSLADQYQRDGGLTADFGYVPLFDRAVENARSLTRAGRDAEAFETICGALRSWRPLSSTHLAPVGLAWDHVLGRIMTRERRERLLSSPRAGVPVG